MRVGIPKETRAGEARVALNPEGVAKLAQSGVQTLVEEGAGAAAFFTDEDYRSMGASVVPNADTVLSADLILKVQPPSSPEIAKIHDGAVLICLLRVLRDVNLISELSKRNVTTISMELVPRITRAQEMDALSSQATVTGYKAVLIGAAELGRVLPMLTTAAGTLTPARVFILGAGVAGLQAIATARRLGAVVSAFDVRPVAKEQVESLGATFVAPESTSQDAETVGGYAQAQGAEAHQRELDAIRQHIGNSDLVITTALVSGRTAPVLITADMVHEMKPGSVIVDLAAEAGGNCALTEPGKTVRHGAVTIIGAVNLASTVPQHASQMYGRNTLRLTQHLIRSGQLSIDLSDEITSAMVVTHQGVIRVPI